MVFHMRMTCCMEQSLVTSVLLWFGTDIIVCADSSFAFVGASKELFRNGLRFIGVLMTATKGFPKAFLSSVNLHKRGDYLAIVSEPAAKNDCDPMMASLCVDGLRAKVFNFNCRRVVTNWNFNCSTTLASGKPSTQC